MICQTTKAFEFQGREYAEGDTIKLGSADYRQLSAEGKVTEPGKFTKVAGQKGARFKTVEQPQDSEPTDILNRDGNQNPEEAEKPTGALRVESDKIDEAVEARKEEPKATKGKQKESK